MQLKKYHSKIPANSADTTVSVLLAMVQPPISCTPTSLTPYTPGTLHIEIRRSSREQSVEQEVRTSALVAHPPPGAQVSYYLVLCSV